MFIAASKFIGAAVCAEGHCVRVTHRPLGEAFSYVRSIGTRSKL